MKEIQVDNLKACVEDDDYPRVSQHTWHLRQGKPRAKIFLLPLNPPHHTQSTRKYPVQITLERFVFKLTPNANIYIKHPLGSKLNCVRSMCWLDLKNKTKSSRYNGVLRSLTGWDIRIDYNGYLYTDSGFGTEQEAAREFDRRVLSYFSWNDAIKLINFYPQL